VTSAFGFTLTVGALFAGLVLRTAAAAAGTGRIYVLAAATGQLALVAVAALLMVDGVRAPGPWLIGYGVALLLGPLLGWWMLSRSDPPATGPEPDPRVARRLGLRLLPATLASMVMLRADRLLLPWLGSYEQLGLYIVVATLTEFVVWPVQSYVDAQSPRWHRAFLAGDLRCRGPLVGAACYGLVSAGTLVVAGNLLVVPVLGPAYRDSSALIAPLAVGAGLYAFSRVAVGLNVAVGRPRAVLTADVPAMVIALACYAALIPRFGAMGAAAASALSYGVGALVAGLLCQGATSRVPSGTRTTTTTAVGTAPLTSGGAR
jgi:O-antigen/teichoic acid export membrane protein